MYPISAGLLNSESWIYLITESQASQQMLSLVWPRSQSLTYRWIWTFNYRILAFPLPRLVALNRWKYLGKSCVGSLLNSEPIQKRAMGWQLTQNNNQFNKDYDPVPEIDRSKYSCWILDLESHISNQNAKWHIVLIWVLAGFELGQLFSPFFPFLRLVGWAGNLPIPQFSYAINWPWSMKAYYSAGPGIREKIVSRFLHQIDLITLAFLCSYWKCIFWLVVVYNGL